jgi:hypothetical protein
MNALLVAAALVLAQDGEGEPTRPLLEAAPTRGFKVLGFTKDHQSVVYSGYSGFDDDSTLVTVVERLTSSGTEVFSAADFEKWLARNPLEEPLASRTSPDGKSVAEVLVDATDNSGSWLNSRWKAAKSSVWKLSVTRNGVTTTAGTVAPADSAEVFWSPDGRYTAWIISVASRGMRDEGSQDLIIASDGRPTASIVMEKSKLAAWAPKISALVDKGGFAVLATTVAKQPRPKSVVFARNPADTAVKELAAKVPGGATVEPLTWASATDVVVYVAEAALK